MSKSYLAILALSVAQFVVGINIALMKYVAPLMPVYIQLELRFLISTLILGLLQYLFARTSCVINVDETSLPNRHEWKYLSLMALTGGLLFNVFMTEGIQQTSALSAGIIVSATPALIAFFCFLFLKERLTGVQVAAIGFAMFGIGILNLRVTDGNAPETALLGDFLVFASIVPEAMYTVVGKKLGTRLRSLSVAFLVNALNVLYFLPMAIYESFSWDASILFDAGYFWLVCGVALGSAQFYILWQYGISKVSGSRAALFTGLMPIGTTLSAVFFLGEAFSAYEACGMIFVMTAILLGAGLIGKEDAWPRNVLIALIFTKL